MSEHSVCVYYEDKDFHCFAISCSRKQLGKETPFQCLNSIFLRAILLDHTSRKIRLKQKISVLMKSQIAHQELERPFHTLRKGRYNHAVW